MSMRFFPTSQGGFRVEGDTPWGKFACEWDASLHVVEAPIEPRVPAVVQQHMTDERRARVAVRLGICQGCEHGQATSHLTVQCGLCGCAGLSLTSGRCPADKWPSNGD